PPPNSSAPTSPPSAAPSASASRTPPCAASATPWTSASPSSPASSSAPPPASTTSRRPTSCSGCWSPWPATSWPTRPAARRPSARRGGRAPAAGLDRLDHPDPGESPSERLIGRELLEEFRKRLSDEERQLAEQRALGREWAELAAERGTSPGALRKRLER